MAQLPRQPRCGNARSPMTSAFRRAQLQIVRPAMKSFGRLCESGAGLTDENATTGVVVGGSDGGLKERKGVMKEPLLDEISATAPITISTGESESVQNRTPATATRQGRFSGKR